MKVADVIILNKMKWNKLIPSINPSTATFILWVFDRLYIGFGQMTQKILHIGHFDISGSTTFDFHPKTAALTAIDH